MFGVVRRSGRGRAARSHAARRGGHRRRHHSGDEPGHGLLRRQQPAVARHQRHLPAGRPRPDRTVGDAPRRRPRALPHGGARGHRRGAVGRRGQRLLEWAGCRVHPCRARPLPRPVARQAAARLPRLSLARHRAGLALRPDPAPAVGAVFAAGGAGASRHARRGPATLGGFPLLCPGRRPGGGDAGLLRVGAPAPGAAAGDPLLRAGRRRADPPPPAAAARPGVAAGGLLRPSQRPDARRPRHQERLRRRPGAFRRLERSGAPGAGGGSRRPRPRRDAPRAVDRLGASLLSAGAAESRRSRCRAAGAGAGPRRRPDARRTIRGSRAVAGSARRRGCRGLPRGAAVLGSEVLPGARGGAARRRGPCRHSPRRGPGAVARQSLRPRRAGGPDRRLALPGAARRRVERPRRPVSAGTGAASPWPRSGGVVGLGLRGRAAAAVPHGAYLPGGGAG